MAGEGPVFFFSPTWWCSSYQFSVARSGFRRVESTAAAFFLPFRCGHGGVVARGWPSRERGVRWSIVSKGLPLPQATMCLWNRVLHRARSWCGDGCTSLGSASTKVAEMYLAINTSPINPTPCLARNFLGML